MNPRKEIKKIIMKNPVIILLVVILLAVLGLGTYTFLANRKKKEEETSTPPTTAIAQMSEAV